MKQSPLLFCLLYTQKEQSETNKTEPLAPLQLHIR